VPCLSHRSRLHLIQGDPFGGGSATGCRERAVLSMVVCGAMFVAGQIRDRTLCLVSLAGSGSVEADVMVMTEHEAATSKET
jgi:hypothetical protein